MFDSNSDAFYTSLFTNHRFFLHYFFLTQSMKFMNNIVCRSSIMFDFLPFGEIFYNSNSSSSSSIVIVVSVVVVRRVATCKLGKPGLTSFF